LRSRASCGLPHPDRQPTRPAPRDPAALALGEHSGRLVGLPQGSDVAVDFGVGDAEACGDLAVRQPFGPQCKHRGCSLFALAGALGCTLMLGLDDGILPLAIRLLSSLVTARVAVQATGGDFGRAGAAHSRRGILGPVARVHARMTTTALAAPLAFAPPLVTVALVGSCPEAAWDHLALTGGAGGV